MACGEDKLPPVNSSTGQELMLRRGAGNNRARTVIGMWSFPPINSHRTDASRTTHTSKGQQSRYNIQFRSHSNSFTTGMTAPRNPFHEAKRFASIAAGRSRAILDKFLDQLKTYHTFQPSFVDGGVYILQKPSRQFRGAAAWDAVGSAIDASTSRAVRHNIDERFMASMELTTHSDTEFAVYSFAALNSFYSRSSTVSSTDKHLVSFELFRSENPDLTSEELRQAQRFWDTERVNYERLSRAKALQKQQEELNGLLGKVVEHSPRREVFPSLGKRGAADDAKHSMRNLTSRFEQQRLWEIFHAGDVSANFGGAKKAVAAETANNYSETDELHNWIEQGWKNHTDRHENAAVCIQCAYRCHCAKLVVARQRYIRRVALEELLLEESKSIETWKSAVCLMKDELADGEENFNVNWRVMKLVSSKLHAMAIKRRAQKEANRKRDNEERGYAALTIQRIYRGHIGRQLAETIRHPELLVIRREARRRAAAIVLQAAWRGHQIRSEMQRKVDAILVIQRLVRRSAGKERLRHLREKRRKATELSSRQFAAGIVVRFLKQCVRCHQAYLMERWEHVCTLRRIAHGYFARLTLWRRWKCMLEVQLRVSLWTQRHFRGSRGRSVARREQENREMLLSLWRRDDAARVIQRTWHRTAALLREPRRRGECDERCNSRKCKPVRSAEEAAVIIQQWFKSMLLVRKARLVHDAWQEQLLLLEAAERILRFYRAAKSRRRSRPS